MTRTLRALGVLAEDLEAVVARLRERSTEELKRCGLGAFALDANENETAADVATLTFSRRAREACRRRGLLRSEADLADAFGTDTNTAITETRTRDERLRRLRARVLASHLALADATRAEGQGGGDWDTKRETRKRRFRFRKRYVPRRRVPAAGPALGRARGRVPAHLHARARVRGRSSARCHAERKRVRARARRASRRVLRVPPRWTPSRRKPRRLAFSRRRRRGWRRRRPARRASRPPWTKCRRSRGRAPSLPREATSRTRRGFVNGGSASSAVRRTPRSNFSGVSRRRRSAAEEATADTPPSENSSTRWKSSSGTWSAADACRWSPREAAKSRRRVAKADPSRRLRRGRRRAPRRTPARRADEPPRSRGRGDGVEILERDPEHRPSGGDRRRAPSITSDLILGVLFGVAAFALVAAAAGAVAARRGARSAARKHASRVRPPPTTGRPSAPTASARTARLCSAAAPPGPRGAFIDT